MRTLLADSLTHKSFPCMGEADWDQLAAMALKPLKGQLSKISGSVYSASLVEL